MENRFETGKLELRTNDLAFMRKCMKCMQDRKPISIRVLGTPFLFNVCHVDWGLKEEPMSQIVLTQVLQT